MFPKASYALTAAVLIAAAPPMGAARQPVGRPVHRVPSRTDLVAFDFAPEAAAQLRAVWSESVREGEERVACLGGVARDGVAQITRIEALPPVGADSSNISAVSSLDDCRPPQWFGTVHTHIARFQGIPYTTFSAPDRDVITIWRHRWQADGVFCVLYSETMAHCEAGERMADAAYAVVPAMSIAPQRGNVIGARR